MKKFALKATVAAAAALASSLSMAFVDMDTPVSGTNGGVYASEIVLDTPSQNLAKGAAADQQAKVELGASFAAGKQAYVRFDLDGGTFSATPAFAINDSNGDPASTPISQGGAADDNYVIFAVNPSTATYYLEADEVGVLTTNGIKVTDKNGVKISYRLYETLTSAVNQTANTALKEKTGIEFITFAPALAVTTVNETATAEVSDPDGPYFNFAGPIATAGIGKVKITHTAKALVGGAASSGAGDFLNDTNAITITGDFTWAKGVTIDGSAATIAADKQSATLSGIAAATLVDGANLDFVVTAPGDAAIPVSNYTSQVKFAPKAKFAVSDVAGGTGEITRNGTTLKFPALSQGKNTTTYLQLVNTGGLNAPLTTECFLNDGTTVAGLSATVPANTTYRNTLDKVCPTDTAKVQSAVLTLAVPSGNVNGTLMRKESTTGVMTYVNASAGNR